VANRNASRGTRDRGPCTRTTLKECVLVESLVRITLVSGFNVECKRVRDDVRNGEISKTGRERERIAYD